MSTNRRRPFQYVRPRSASSTSQNEPSRNMSSTTNRMPPAYPYTRIDLRALKYFDLNHNTPSGPILDLSTSEAFKNLKALQTQIKAKLLNHNEVVNVNRNRSASAYVERPLQRPVTSPPIKRTRLLPRPNSASPVQPSTSASHSFSTNPSIEDVQTILHRRPENPMWNGKSTNSSTESLVEQSRYSSPSTGLQQNVFTNQNRLSGGAEASSSMTSTPQSEQRPQTAPEVPSVASMCQSMSTSSCQSSWGGIGCLKNRGPGSKSRQSVSFAPETLNIERENKPTKLKPPKNNRKQKFAHPCRGHFVPPDREIMAHFGPEGSVENLYTQFASVWCHPDSRLSTESLSKNGIRFQRFKKLLSDLTLAHDSFNDVPENLRTALMLEEILPRYILAMDIALMDAAYDHTEQLLVTIASSVRILQINLHDVFFDIRGNPKPLQQIPPGNDGFFVKLGPLIFALNRICDKKFGQCPNNLAIEPQLVKLQLELLVLAISPPNCLMFRSILAVVPTTAKRALELLDSEREKSATYCVKWINDSVMHRDYMATMKYLRMSDEYGAVEKIPVDLLSSKSRSASQVLSEQANQRNSVNSVTRRPRSSRF